MMRADFDNIRLAVADILDKDQLGMMKGGYETGVHAMRALEYQYEDSHLLAPKAY